MGWKNHVHPTSKTRELPNTLAYVWQLSNYGTVIYKFLNTGMKLWIIDKYMVTTLSPNHVNVIDNKIACLRTKSRDKCRE